MIDLRNELPRVRNQHGTQDCVAIAVSTLLEHAYGIGIGHLSPLYIYGKRSTPQGMFVDEALDVAVKYGTCRDAYFNFDTQTDLGSDDAYKFKAKGWHDCTGLEATKAELDAHKPVIITTLLYNQHPEFWNRNSAGDRESVHATVIVGYNKEGFIIRNCWGDKWCDKGYTVMPFEQYGSSVNRAYCLTGSYKATNPIINWLWAIFTPINASLRD